MIILDTNVVSELMSQHAASQVVAWLDAQPKSEVFTTAISLFEARAGLIAMSDGRRKAGMVAAFDALTATLLHDRVLPLDGRAAEFAAQLSVLQYRSGQNVELNDRYIAGIVLARNARLATRNIKHFAEIGDRLINPWEA